MTKIIEFYIYPDALGLDITGPLEVFALATRLLNQRGHKSPAYHPVFSGAQPGPVRLSSGLSLMAEAAVGRGPRPDIFLVPGGFGVDRVIASREAVDPVRAAAKRARRIVSVCNGAFILAACGLLGGRSVTTHWQFAADLERRYPELVVNPDAIFIKDGQLATSAGVTAGIDLALSILEDDHGTALAMDVARFLVLYLRRPGYQRQFSAPLEARERAGERFRALYDWLLLHIRCPLTVESMAARAGMSPRNFSRVFAGETGMGPGKFLETMRLDLARELLESGRDNLETVAEMCGFGREERLLRVFVRRLGITPRQYRAHFDTATQTLGTDSANLND